MKEDCVWGGEREGLLCFEFILQERELILSYLLALNWHRSGGVVKRLKSSQSPKQK